MTTTLSTGVRGTHLEPGDQEGDFILNMGPQHPSTHGVLRVILKTEGENVVWCDSDIGYLHRGQEKTAENLPYPEYTPYTDRLDYLAAPAMNLAWVEAVEKLMLIQVPERGQYVRVIIAELSRIASHLLWLGTHAMDIGALTTFLYCFREREMILDLFEAFGGARLTTHIFRVGGLPQGPPLNLVDGVPPGWFDGVEAFLKIFPSKLKEYHTLLTKNRIWLRRTKEIGIISGQDCVAWGLSGPIIRASGIGYDLRKMQPYEVYSRLDFEVPVYHGCDVYDRYMVRMDEMAQSSRIIRQCLDQMPKDGPVNAELPKKLKTPAGEIYHAVESPRGEFGFYINSDGGEVPYRVKVRPTSFVNLQALPVMATGALIADVVAVIGSIDIVLGEVDH